MTKQSKPPIWFWIVSAIALLWNLMGVKAYLDQAYGTNDVLGEIANAAKDLIDPTPAWVTSAFAIAVFGGAVGSLLLLLRRSLAHTILIVSLMGIVAQMSYNLFMTDNPTDSGPGGMLMVVMIIAAGIGLVFFAKKAKTSGWLK
jgi:hypothetical protein